MKCLHDKIVLELEKTMHDKIHFKSGVELWFDPTYNVNQHVISNAVVHHVGAGVKTDIRIGDMAYISYFAALMALGMKADRTVEGANETWMIQDGKIRFIVSSLEVFFVIRDGEMVNVNNRIVVKPFQTNPPSRIILRSPVTPKLDEKRSIVLISDFEDIRPGDIVHHKPYVKEQIGYSLHNQIVGIQQIDFEIYSIRYENILAVSRNEKATISRIQAN